MPHFEFTASKTIEANSEDEARELFADMSRDFVAATDCVELQAGVPRARCSDERDRVLITVRGGVAEAYYDDAEVMVEIFDFDEYEAEGKHAEPYLENLVRNWGFPDPRKTGATPPVGHNRSHDCGKVSRPDHELFRLVAEDAQVVADKELGRKLTEEELRVVKCKIGDYIDWQEAMTYCLQQQIAREL